MEQNNSVSKLRNMRQATFDYIKVHRIVFVYLALAISIGLISQFFVSAKPYIVHFWLPAMLLASICLLMLSMRSPKTQGILASFFLGGQFIIIFAGVFLYNSNGSAFQHEMFNMRDDAWGTMEFIPVQPLLIAILLLTYAGFLTFVIIDVKRRKIKLSKIHLSKKQRFAKWSKLGLALSLAVLFSVMPLIDGMRERGRDDYFHRLTSMRGDWNQMRGITTNVIYETLKFGPASGVSLRRMDEFWSFIENGGAAVTSDFHGVSAGNNLVLILAESLDTHILEMYSPDQTRELFPNITRLLEGGISATNFHLKEKTDTAEAFSLLGALPSRGSIHYNFHRNEFPFSLPSKMRAAFDQAGHEDPQLYAFHQNRPAFYNRNRLYPQMGFDRFWSINDMTSRGVKNTWQGGFNPFRRNERTLDSQTVRQMRDYMFPKDRAFFTYWISFVKHGFYQHRNNLEEQGYYNRLDELGMFLGGSKMDDFLRNYVAAALDFDKALGYMFEDLEQKGLLDTTTIVVVSDHETYYHDMARHFKDVNHHIDPETFRIPMTIYCRRLKDAFKLAGRPHEITKFTTMQDLVPTILDMFGVPAWRNLYFGHSMLQEACESIAFSRVYNFFMNDRLSFFNANNMDYRTAKYVEGDTDIFIERAKIHLEKLFWLDRLYFSDFFRHNPYFPPE